MALDWKFWPVLGGLAAIAVAAFAVPASPAYYDTDGAMIGEYVPVIHSGNGVCITEYASDGLTKKIMDCSAEVGEVVLIQYEPGQGSAIPVDDVAYFATGGDTMVESGNVPVKLVVTTHDPACTAIFMHGRDGVALRTELRPDPFTANSYTAEEIRTGISLTYTTTARLAGELVPVLVERRDVLSIASYSVSDPPSLLGNVISPVTDDRCVDIQVPAHLFPVIYDIVLQSSKASGGSGTAASGQIMPWINISTTGSNAEALAFLDEHGITVGPFISEPTPTSRGYLSAHDIPLSLLIPLIQLDSVLGIDEPHLLELAQ